MAGSMERLSDLLYLDRYRKEIETIQHGDGIQGFHPAISCHRPLFMYRFDALLVLLPLITLLIPVFCCALVVFTSSSTLVRYPRPLCSGGMELRVDARKFPDKAEVSAGLQDDRNDQTTKSPD